MLRSRTPSEHKWTWVDSLLLSLVIGGLAIVGYSQFGLSIATTIQKADPGQETSAPELAIPSTGDVTPPVPVPVTSMPAKTARPAVLTVSVAAYRRYPSSGDEVGEIRLPSIHESWPIVEGTTNGSLARGVGHYATSVLPGEADNSVLAGHRETVFKNIGKLHVRDHILVTTSAGLFDYTITGFRVVDRSDRTVIVPTPRATLTLVTCYPINLVGVTHQSFIVTAELVGSKLTTN